jgi:mannosyltransferase
VIKKKKNNTFIISLKENFTSYYLPLVFIFIVGLLARFTNLADSSLRLDESQSIWQASHSLEFIINYSAQNVHLPLYNILLHYWMLFFGSTEASTRTLSALIGILNLIVGYYLSREMLSDKRKVLFAFFIFSVSPFLIWYSRETRMYSMLALFSSLSYLYYVRLLKNSNLKTFVPYLISIILGIYTHYFFFLNLLVQFTFLVVAYKLDLSIVPFKNKKKALYTFLSASFLAFVIFLPWIYFYLTHNAGGNLAPSFSKPTSFQVVLSMFEFTFGYQNNIIITLFLSMWPIIALLAFSTLSKKGSRFSPEVLLSFMGFVIPFAIVYLVSITIKPIYLTRYLIPTVPLFYVFIAWFINFDNSRYRIILKTLVIVAFVLALFMQYKYKGANKDESYREAVAYVNENVKINDVVAVSPPYTVFPVQYYYTNLNVPLTTLPVWDRTELNLPEPSEDRISSDVKSFQEIHPKVFIISTTNLAGGKEVLDYMDHHYKKTDEKVLSPDVVLSVYQLKYNQSALSKDSL